MPLPDLSEVLSTRVARFADLDVLEAQKTHDVPQDVLDLIYSRKLMSVISLEGSTESPISGNAPISGAGGMTITYAQCPPGTGPTLHNHRETYETFTVMQGRFEFYLGAKGEESVILDQFDTISVPPGYHRAFTNISEEDGLLQVIITGGVHDMNDIYFPKATADKISAKGDDYLDYFKKVRLAFSESE